MIDFYNMAFVGFGTLSGIMFSMYHDDFKGSIPLPISSIIPFLTHFFPNRSDKFYYRLNTIIVLILGTILGYCLIEPSNIRTSIIAGFTWNAVLISIIKKNNNRG